VRDRTVLACAWLSAGLLLPTWAVAAPPERLPVGLAPGAEAGGWGTDTGMLEAGGLEPGNGLTRLRPQSLASTVVYAERAGWIRLDLSGTLLSGDSAIGDAAAVVIRSLEDGAEQRLDAEALRMWGGTTAYFNGSAVEVELVGHAGAGPSRLVVAGGWVGEPVELASGDDLCGADDRVASSDVRIARLMNGQTVCTAWLFDDFNRFFLSAGHCAPTSTSVVQFNVPPSGTDGSLRMPVPADQFTVDGASVQSAVAGANNDWSYFGVLPNTSTGLTPIQQYGQFFTRAAAPAVAGQTIAVTGYGSVSTGNLALNFAQTTSTGAYTLVLNNLVRYNVDTTGGNSGSPVIDLSTGRAIAIHYFAGCLSGGNMGVNVANANLLAAIASPRGVCRTGRGTVMGDLWAIGDLANNFGTASVAPSNFAGVSKFGRWWRGLAYSGAEDVMYAVDSTRQLFRVSRSGASTLVGVVSGPVGPLAGLAFKVESGLLYTMEPATGQLWAIEPGTATGTAVGPAFGGTGIIGLDYDARDDVLFGVTRGTPSATLWRIDPNTGSRTQVGGIAGVTSQITDIAFHPLDRHLYFINTSTGAITQVDPVSLAVSTVGTSVGPTNGVWGTNHGLAFAVAQRACDADYNADGFFSLDDLGDFVTDYYASPAIPGGLQVSAPTYPDRVVGYGGPCAEAPDAASPYAVDAYRRFGYRVGFLQGGGADCPMAPSQSFPNLDHLNDFLTAFYSGC
jgi:V8-like Glu-specific endopeptidase